MDRLDAMKLFTRIVESGSFSAVAREAEISQPTVSKHLAALEAHLGVQLVHRNARTLRLTEAGQTYYDASVRLLADIESLETEVRRDQSRPAGTLSVTLSPGFGRLHIVPLLPAFYARYPDIAIEIVVSDRFVDLLEEGIDVALRIGHLPDSALIARLIGSSPRSTFAAAKYVERAGCPTTPKNSPIIGASLSPFKGGSRNGLSTLEQVVSSTVPRVLSARMTRKISALPSSRG